MRVLLGKLFLIVLFCMPVVPVLAQTSIETQMLRLVFSDQGRLVRATICFPRCALDRNRQIELQARDGIVGFENGRNDGWVLQRDRKDGIHQLRFIGPNGERIHWKIPEQGYLVELETLDAGGLSLNAGPDFRPRQAPGFGGWLEQVRYLSLTASGVEQHALDGDEQLVSGEWVGFRSRYWTVLARSSGRDTLYELKTGHDNRDAVLKARAIAATGETLPGISQNHVIYFGPIEPGTLAAADDLLPDIMYAGLWFWLRWICFALYYLLGWVQSLLPAWGLAIMALSLLVHVLMLPLSRLADRVQQGVNEVEARLAPELSQIKQSFRGEEQATKILALYKSQGVTPLHSLKSMLGVAIVIPVFIGAFDMLAENIHLLNAKFLWIDDLSRPDALFLMPFEIPFLGQGFNLLPWLMTGLSLLASALHEPLVLDAASRARQIRHMSLLALAFFVLFYTFPAGMVLYWTTNNLISAGKSVWARR